MVVPRAYVHQAELASDVERAKQKLGPEVVSVRYSLKDDTSGEPAIYFRIVLTDEASQRERLGEVADRVERVLSNESGLLENWDLQSYFSFRSQSEQAARKYADWA